MSKTLSLHHLVINTYQRKMTIAEEHKKSLYAYIFGILKNHDCFVHRINGIPNHVHIFFDMNPTISLATIVQDIKQSSSVWLKSNSAFPDWQGWGREYFAFSKSREDIDKVKNYIVNQESHHRGVSYEDEMRDLIGSEGFDWKDYLLT